MSLFEHGARQLCRLAGALHIPSAEHPRLLELFHGLSQSWGARSPLDTPRWSGVTDDCSPFEFSVALSADGVELRMLAEAQADPASPASYWQSGMDLSRSLRARFGADLGALDKVSSLFQPYDQVWFSTIHGAVLWPRPQPLYKIYLNPAARGRAAAPKVMKAALARLGLEKAWAALEAHVRPEDAYQFLALDLLAGAEARVKVYVRHPAPALERLVEAVAPVDPDTAQEIIPLCRTIFGRKVTRLPRPALTMYTLGPSGLLSAACHAPSYPFAGTDRQLARRMSQFLAERGLPVRPYRRAVAALTGGLDEDARGIHNYFSVQRRGEQLRVTTYLCPRVYLRRLGAIGYDPVVAWPTPVGGVPELVPVAEPVPVPAPASLAAPALVATPVPGSAL